MQNQDMQFADPEWRPPQQTSSSPGQQDSFQPQPINADRPPQPFNTDPREQPQNEREYNEAGLYGDSGAQKIGTAQFGQRQNRRRSPWLWVIVLLVIMALLGGGLGLPRGGHHFSRIEPAHTFSVSALPTIVINDDVGTIHVHTGGTNGNVLVQVTEANLGPGNNPDSGQVSYNQNSASNTVTVNANSGPGFFGSNSIDLDVTVPTDSNLQIKTDTGEIDVTGITGQMSLSSSTGSIHAVQDSLTGQSILKTDTGSVTFEGTIDPKGSYQFETNTGSVDVTLPDNSSFHVDASTDTGSINSDFPGVNVQHADITGASAHSDVGSSPGATVTLKTDTGSISLHQGR
jgi:hypothetical protein